MNLDVIYDDFVMFDVLSRKWVTLPLWDVARGGPRTGHCLQYDLIQNSLVLFGGQITRNNFANDLWYYDIALEYWYYASQYIPIGTSEPPVRYLHACTVDQLTGDLYVQGGIAISQVFGDLWQFHTKNYTWALLSPGNQFSILREHALFYDRNITTFYLLFGLNARPQNGIISFFLSSSI